jgi:hypothetical protein
LSGKLAFFRESQHGSGGKWFPVYLDKLPGRVRSAISRQGFILFARGQSQRTQQ